MGAAALATAFHTPALVLFPAGVLAIVAFWASEDPARLRSLMTRFRAPLVGAAIVFAGVSLVLFGPVFRFWLSASHGQFGNYSALQIAVALFIFVGPGVWALALFPLLDGFEGGTGRGADSLGVDRGDATFCLALAMGVIVPLFGLSFFGGGVAPGYMVAGVPAIFVLAGGQWERLDAQIGHRVGLRTALAAALFAFSIPYLASIAVGGNHFDYRAAAAELDASLAKGERADVLASSRLTFGLYLEAPVEVAELGRFENGVPRDRLENAMAVSRAGGRGLWLVSREDRKRLSGDDQAWLYERFQLVRDWERPRFDHRRFRMALYRMRDTP